MKTRHLIPAVAVLALASVHALAKAPTSKDVMQPVDTSAGSITDPRKMLTVNLDAPVSTGVNGATLEIAVTQLHALSGIEFGYTQGVNKLAVVTFNSGGTLGDALHALGSAAKIRYEANGPSHLRILPATVEPLRKTPKEAPPVKKD